LAFNPITSNLEAYDGRYGLDDIAKVSHLFDIVGV